MKKPMTILGLMLFRILLWGQESAHDPIGQDPPADQTHPATMAELVMESQGSKIMGLIYMPVGKGPHPTLVMAHGFPGNERNLDLAQIWRRAGWNTLYFNYRGSWGSQGSYSYANCLQDIDAVLAFLKLPESVEKYRVDARRLVLFGHSFGGGLSLLASLKNPQVKGVISLAGFNVGALANYLAQSNDLSFAAYAEKQVCLRLESGMALQDELIANREAWNLVNRAPELVQKKLLLISDSKDEQVSKALYHTPLAEALEKAGAKELTHVLMETDHAFSAKRIAVANAVLEWLEKQGL